MGGIRWGHGGVSVSRVHELHEFKYIGCMSLSKYL